MSHFEQPYLDLLNRILTEGEVREDRTGVGTLSVFGGPELKFDLREAFPVVTIKKTLWKSAFTEMLWFIKGESNIKFLKEHNIPIWDAWADADGNLGPVYGVQWRRWASKIKTVSSEELASRWNLSGDSQLEDTKHLGEFLGTHKYLGETRYVFQESLDQMKNLINDLKNNPRSRRHIVTAWNPAFIKEMGLPPCHYLFQCYVSNDKHLDLKMSIRSWDTCLGGPFNIAQYALLTHLIARAADLKPRYLMISYGDAHIYLNHVDPIKELLATTSPIDCRPQLVITSENTDIDGYTPGDFEVINYKHGKFLKLPIAV